MTDPLSITLAVITLATALKDIIETASAIQDSFSKLPQNYQNAQKLAKLVSKTLQEMQDIYQEKQVIFDGSPHLTKTINDLRAEMKLTCEKCAHLIPPRSERKRDRFKIAFYSFWSREEVEGLISELYDHVDRCSQQFIVLDYLMCNPVSSSYPASAPKRSSWKFTTPSIMRSDIPTVLLQFKHHHHWPQQFRQSRHPAQWIQRVRKGQTIPVHDLSKAYLRCELGKINLFLQSISVPWLSQNPTSYPTAADGISEIPILNISWFLGKAPLPSAVVHQDAVVLAFRIQDLQRERPSNAWIHASDVRARAGLKSPGLGQASRQCWHCQWISTWLCGYPRFRG
ncbi:hypothetical protein BJ912DRAFT_928727 [Pholiota molesta]|nr:hypothetical protein BJ912DRAFT_928727 [Pholiota molesta]